MGFGASFHSAGFTASMITPKQITHIILLAVVAECVLPLRITSAGPIQLLLCCKGAKSSLCKIPWVDCVHKNTSDGNLQAVLFYSSFTLYFRMNLFALVGTSLEMHILTPREHLSGVDFAFHLHSGLREFSLLMQLSLQRSWSFLPIQFQNHDLGISLPSSRHGLLLLLQLSASRASK